MNRPSILSTDFETPHRGILIHYCSGDQPTGESQLTGTISDTTGNIACNIPSVHPARVPNSRPVLPRYRTRFSCRLSMFQEFVRVFGTLSSPSAPPGLSILEAFSQSIDCNSHFLRWQRIPRGNSLLKTKGMKVNIQALQNYKLGQPIYLWSFVAFKFRFRF